jgi:hypothetical protein
VSYLVTIAKKKRKKEGPENDGKRQRYKGNKGKEEVGSEMTAGRTNQKNGERR